MMPGRSSSLWSVARWAAAALFAGATLLYVGAWLVAARYQPAVELGYDSDYLATEQAQSIRRPLPGSPAEQMGLRPGDRIVAIEGSRLSDATFQARAWSRYRPGETVRLSVTRTGESTPRVMIGTFRRRVPRSNADGLTTLAADEVLRFYPLPFVIVGLTVLFLRLDDVRAWLLALTLAGFASTPAMPESIGIFAQGLQPFIRIYQGVCIGSFAPAFYVFFAIFPARSPIDRRAPWLKWVGLAMGAAVAVASSEGRGVRFPSAIPHLIGDDLAAKLAVWWLLAMLTLGVASLASNFFGGRDEQTRRKTRVIFWGTAVALVPNVLIVAVTTQARLREPTWLEAVRAICAFVLPLSLAYAVVKHHVLELPVLLRRGARYLLVQRGFTSVLALITMGVIGAVAAWAAPALGLLGDAALPWSVAAGAVLGTVLLWGGAAVHRRVSDRIDRAFFRQAYDARAILQDLANQAGRVTDRVKLAELLQRHVADALQPASLAVCLQDRDGRMCLMTGEWPGVAEAIPESWWSSDPDVSEARSREEARAGAAPFPPEPEYLVRVPGRDGELRGVLVLGPRRSEEPYSQEDASLLAVVADQAALALDNLSLAEQMAVRLEADRRHQYELAIAQEVQQLLLPQRMPPLATLDYAGACTQARVVGGDYFDYLNLAPGRVGFVIADISGKGMAAALLMANLQAMVRSDAPREAGALGPMLASVNRRFHDVTAANRFATMFCGDYDDAARTLTYVNCGHNPPLLLRADGRIEWLAPTAVALGFFGEWSCQTETRHLEPGDVLVLYSDGITEAWSDAGVEFGDARLVAAVQAYRALPASGLVNAIMADVKAFSAATQSDDWTLIVARVRQN
jgi:phosphoserine phosphatase RsbU/P